MAHKIDSASGSITLISEDGSGNVNLTLPRAGLGTAASADTGTAAGNIPVLDGSGQIASGVLTNAAVADNAITLAKMAHGTDGELITYDATGAPANVAVGTSGQVLTSGGAGVAPTFQAAAGATDIDELSDGTTSGTNNVGLGSTALTSNTTGSWNTAVGSAPLNANTTGYENAAIGWNAMYSNTTGYTNTAVGSTALYNNTTGRQNTAIGSKALYTNTANFNTAIGDSSLRLNTTGYENAAIGWNAMYSNTTGYRNTGLGKSALEAHTTGNWCTGVGYYAEASSATASSEMTLGNTNISNLRCNDTSISSLSDQRDKAEITDLPDSAGLDLINSLRPVTYFWDRREWYEDGVTDGSKIKRDYRTWKHNSGQRQGFIAQEVESAISGHKYLEDSQVVNGTEDKKEFAPQHLLTNAIKAIQQLSAEVEILKSEIATLKGV